MTSNGSTSDPSASELLQDWILDGLLPPGQRLPVRDVARGLGISTMPVREALVRLEEAGMVSQQKHKGAVVSRLSVNDLKDFYGLRQLLEPASIELGTQRISTARHRRLVSTLQQLEEAVAQQDSATVLDLDEDLLSIIHAAAENRQVVRVIRSTWARIRPYKLLFTTTAQADAGAVMLNENTQLVKAVGEMDAAAARSIMESSLHNAELQLVDFLRSQDTTTPHTAETPLAKGESLASYLAELRRAQLAQASPTLVV